MKYWIQEQAPNGGYFDSIGLGAVADDRPSAIEQARSWQKAWPNKKVRLVERVDTEIDFSLNVAPDVSLTPEEREQAGKHRQWMHEATRLSDGSRLYTAVTYNHSTRGKWECCIRLSGTGQIRRLSRIPAISVATKAWKLTAYGLDVREEGRN